MPSCPKVSAEFHKPAGQAKIKQSTFQCNKEELIECILNETFTEGEIKIDIDQFLSNSGKKVPNFLYHTVCLRCLYSFQVISILQFLLPCGDYFMMINYQLEIQGTLLPANANIIQSPFTAHSQSKTQKFKPHNIKDQNKLLQDESSVKVGHFINNIKQVITDSHSAQEKFNIQFQ